MKKILSILINRLTLTVLLILIQVLWFLSMFVKITDIMPWLDVALKILSILIILFITLKNDNPAYKILWIVLICFLPLLGGLLYLCFGNKRPSRNMRNKISESSDICMQYLNHNPNITDDIDKRALGTMKYINDFGPYPVHQNTKAKYFSSGESAFDEILKELEKAEKYIFIEFFIVAQGKMWSDIHDILVKKAKNGVDVRLIYDDMGSLNRVPTDFKEQLENEGIKCITFNAFKPFISIVMNHRDHRKMIVIDGKVAFSGGVNIGDEYINVVKRYGYWKDTVFKLEGEAVWNYVIMFLTMWNSFYETVDLPEKFKPNIDYSSFESDGYIQPFTDSPLDNEALSENIYLDLLSLAKDYVYIFTPYMAITNEMQRAIINAAKRGVDVRIVTPHISDNKIIHKLTRSYYRVLITGGVKIYEYTPGFIHAKSFVVDDKIAVIGTINMDYRSLYLHFECGCLFYNSSIIDDLKQDNLQTQAVSKQVKLTRFNESFLGVLFDAVLRLFSPLL